MSKSDPVSRRRFVQQAAVGGAALTGLAAKFFGQVEVDRDSKAMTVALKDIAGTAIFSQVLAPKNR